MCIPPLRMMLSLRCQTGNTFLQALQGSEGVVDGALRGELEAARKERDDALEAAAATATRSGRPVRIVDASWKWCSESESDEEADGSLPAEGSDAIEGSAVVAGGALQACLHII